LTYRITLEPFGVTFECAEDESILDAAIRTGIALRYGCKHGGCGTCKARILDGEVDLDQASGFALMEYEREAGLALLCSAIPLEDVVVQLDDDYEEAQLYTGVPIRTFRARISDKRALTHDICFLRLMLEKPAAIEFNAGQYVEVQVPETDQWRAFSMANSPGNSGQIDLMIKILPGGLFSGAVTDHFAVGTEIMLRGPFGQFNLSDSAVPIVMVAGGSGMAPIVAMLAALAEQNTTREIIFYYGAQSARDLFWLDEIAAFTARLPSFRFVPALSAESGTTWQGERGLVTEVLDRLSGNLRGSEAYLCGPPAMIDAAIVVLRAKGMFSARIRYDKFVSTAS
jgi:NAD(P)H-flavin reductase/ferredoxin